MDEVVIPQQLDVLLVRAFVRLTNRWEGIRRYWKVGSEGFARMEFDEASNIKESLEWAIGNPQLLKDPTRFEEFSKTIDVEAIARTYISSYRSTLDGSCLVFLHAELELTIVECLEVCAVVKPQEFLPDVASDKLFQQNAQQKLRKTLRGLERASLPSKLEALYRICGVEIGDDHRSFMRLKAIDQLRHDVVHRPGSAVPNFDHAQSVLRAWGKKSLELVMASLELTLKPDVYKAVLLEETDSLGGVATD